MSKLIPTSLTIEEAVALMIGLDYIPSGLTVLDMTSAFLEESEVEFENNPDSDSFRIRHDICLARHQLADRLITALTHEASLPNSQYLIRTNEVSPTLRFSTDSLNHWGQDSFGITLWAPSMPDNRSEELAGVTWRDITIKIYADYRIGYRIKDGKHRISSFHDIRLMGSKKKEPNALGLTLVGLSEGRKFPARMAASKPTQADRTAISKIRDALRELVPLDDDPFAPYNPADGWKPNFKLIDDRRNADERAKKNAVHVSLDLETRDFEIENDAAEQWLKEHGNQ